MKLASHFQLVSRLRNVDLYIHFPLLVHGVVLSWLSTVITLYVFYIFAFSSDVYSPIKSPNDGGRYFEFLRFSFCRCLCWIRSTHGGDYEEYRSMRFNFEESPTFRRKMWPVSSGLKSEPNKNEWKQMQAELSFDPRRPYPLARLLLFFIYMSFVIHKKWAKSNPSHNGILFENPLKLISLKAKGCPRNRPWRPIGLWDVKDLTLSRQSARKWRKGQPYSPAVLYSPEI
jgi:hypothetical protein